MNAAEHNKQGAFLICKTLSAHGYRALFAGGCVRDFLLHIPPADIDIATSASPAEVVSLFSRTVTVGAKFGVVGLSTALADEVAPDAYQALLARLSHQSVVKHFDAYADIAWDSTAFEIRGDDPRWVLSADDSLGGTAWYQALDPGVQAQLGLDLIASKMKIGSWAVSR